MKPNLLGTKKEFLNRFVNPILNGQCADSSVQDVKLMKNRAHVLHETLAGCVQVTVAIVSTLLLHVGCLMKCTFTNSLIYMRFYQSFDINLRWESGYRCLVSLIVYEYSPHY